MRISNKGIRWGIGTSAMIVALILTLIGGYSSMQRWFLTFGWVLVLSVFWSGRYIVLTIRKIEPDDD